MGSMVLRQIHKIRSFETMKFVEDPATGRQVQQRLQQFDVDSSDRVVHDGQVYEVQPDGSFHVPVELAEFLCRQPGWFAGPNPFAEKLLQGRESQRQAARKPVAKAAA